MTHSEANHLLRYQYGFSLLEVILVLVLAALIMGSVATSLTEGPVLRKTAREVASSLRHARSIAIMQQKSMVWTMDINDKKFWIEGREAKQRELHQSLTAKINTAAQEVVSASRANIRFYPDGSSSGGSVEIETKGQAYKVNVEWISGRISIQ